MKPSKHILPLFAAIAGLVTPAMAQEQAPPPAGPDTKPLNDIIGKLATDENIRHLLENVDVEKLMNDENLRKALGDAKNIGEILKNVDLGKVVVEGNIAPAPAQQPNPPPVGTDTKPLNDIIGKLATDENIRHLLENVDVGKLMNDENLRKALGDAKNIGEILKNVDLGKVEVTGSISLAPTEHDAGGAPKNGGPRMRMLWMNQSPDGKAGAPQAFGFHTFGKDLAGGFHAGAWHIGVICAPVDAMLRDHLDLPKDAGIIITEVVEGSPAAKAGIEVHDIVISANQQPVGDLQSLAQAVQRAGAEGKPLVLETLHKGNRGNITVQPEGPPQHGESGENAAPQPMAGALAEQARQIEELRDTVKKQQRAINQLHKQVGKLLEKRAKHEERDDAPPADNR